MIYEIVKLAKVCRTRICDCLDGECIVSTQPWSKTTRTESILRLAARMAHGLFLNPNIPKKKKKTELLEVLNWFFHFRDHVTFSVIFLQSSTSRPITM